MHKSVVSCTCGETYETISTRKELKVEICSKCHPFFSGKKKIIDTGGRLDKFRKRYKDSKGAYQISDEDIAAMEEEESTENQ